MQNPQNFNFFTKELNRENNINAKIQAQIHNNEKLGYLKFIKNCNNIQMLYSNNLVNE
jgi:hypothetical protein